MTDDFNRLLSNFDESQLESLCVVLKAIASVKHECITGITTLELHSSQGQIGDIYSWNKKKIRSSRKRRIRSKGI
jgi:hypothetical protein